ICNQIPVNAAMDEAERVLEFWFGTCGADGSLDPARKKMWFGEGRNHDIEISNCFGALHERASRGALEAEWTATPRSTIALIVVLDQFSRHIHRGRSATFAQDATAQRLVMSGLE